MRIVASATAGILSALPPVLMKKTDVLLSEDRLAFEQQEPVTKLTCFIVSCPEPESLQEKWELLFFSVILSRACFSSSRSQRSFCVSVLLAASQRLFESGVYAWRPVSMSEMTDLPLLSSGSQIVVSYPG